MRELEEIQKEYGDLCVSLGELYAQSREMEAVIAQRVARVFELKREAKECLEAMNKST